MTTAVNLVSEAYRKHNLKEVTSFSTTQEFPYKLSINVINDTLKLMNRLGSYWFTETSTTLPYSAGVYTYTLSDRNIDPKRILYVRTEATDHWGELKQYNKRDFLRRYRKASVTTTKPSAWTKYGGTLELNTIPDQDYSIKVYHFQDLQPIQSTSDTTLIPEEDEDVLVAAMFEMLGYYMGKQKFQEAEIAIQQRVKPLLADMKQDAGLPLQRPAAF